MSSSFSFRWVGASGQNTAAALAKTDARGAVLLTECANHNGVAVFEEAACFARWQRERLGSPPRTLEQAAGGIAALVGDGAAGDEVAGVEVAAIGCVVRKHLRKG